jgi:methionine-rich copper-binding protein CopC
MSKRWLNGNSTKGFYGSNSLVFSALLLAAALTIVMWGNFALTAEAHAHLKTATLGPDAVVNKSPASITLTFGEESDLKLTQVQVLDASGASVATGPASVTPNDATTWTVNLKAGLADGTYTVKYHTLTDDDGAIVDGSYTFKVAASATAATGAVTNDSNEKESGGDAGVPATGQGGAVQNTNADGTGVLGWLSIAIAVFVAASATLLWVGRSHTKPN